MQALANSTELATHQLMQPGIHFHPQHRYPPEQPLSTQQQQNRQQPQLHTTQYHQQLHPHDYQAQQWEQGLTPMSQRQTRTIQQQERVAWQQQQVQQLNLLQEEQRQQHAQQEQGRQQQQMAQEQQAMEQSQQEQASELQRQSPQQLQQRQLAQQQQQQQAHQQGMSQQQEGRDKSGGGQTVGSASQRQDRKNQHRELRILQLQQEQLQSQQLQDQQQQQGQQEQGYPHQQPEQGRQQQEQSLQELPHTQPQQQNRPHQQQPRQQPQQHHNHTQQQPLHHRQQQSDTAPRKAMAQDQTEHKYPQAQEDLWQSSELRQQITDIRHHTSDIKHRTSDIRHLTSDIRHRTSDTRHQTSDIRRQPPQSQRQQTGSSEEELEEWNAIEAVPDSPGLGGKEQLPRKSAGGQLEQQEMANSKAAQLARYELLQERSAKKTAEEKASAAAIAKEKTAKRQEAGTGEDEAGGGVERQGEDRQRRQSPRLKRQAQEQARAQEEQEAEAKAPAVEKKVMEEGGPLLIQLKMVSQEWLDDTLKAWKVHITQPGYKELKARRLEFEPPGIIKEWKEAELKEHDSGGRKLLAAGGEGGSRWIFPDDARWSVNPLMGKDPEKDGLYPCDVAGVDASTAKCYELAGGKGTYCMCCVDKITSDFALRNDAKHGWGRVHFVNGDICFNSDKGYGWCPLHLVAITTLRKLEGLGWRRPSSRGQGKEIAAPPVPASPLADNLRRATAPPQCPGQPTKRLGAACGEAVGAGTGAPPEARAVPKKAAVEKNGKGRRRQKGRKKPPGLDSLPPDKTDTTAAATGSEPPPKEGVRHSQGSLHAAGSGEEASSEPPKTRRRLAAALDKAGEAGEEPAADQARSQQGTGTAEDGVSSDPVFDEKTAWESCEASMAQKTEMRRGITTEPSRPGGGGSKRGRSHKKDGDQESPLLPEAGKPDKNEDAAATEGKRAECRNMEIIVALDRVESARASRKGAVKPKEPAARQEKTPAAKADADKQLPQPSRAKDGRFQRGTEARRAESGRRKRTRSVEEKEKKAHEKEQEEELEQQAEMEAARLGPTQACTEPSVCSPKRHRGRGRADRPPPYALNNPQQEETQTVLFEHAGGVPAITNKKYYYLLPSFSGKTGEGGKPLLEFKQLAVSRNPVGELSVIAAWFTHAFAILPVVGYSDSKEGEDGAPRTHYYEYVAPLLHLKGADGRPTPYERKHGLASAFGLGISMLINEPPKGVRPNVQFRGNCIITMVDIKAGEQLYGFYGDSYERGGGWDSPEYGPDVDMPSPAPTFKVLGQWVEHFTNILHDMMHDLPVLHRLQYVPGPTLSARMDISPGEDTKGGEEHLPAIPNSSGEEEDWEEPKGTRRTTTATIKASNRPRRGIAIGAKTTVGGKSAPATDCATERNGLTGGVGEDWRSGSPNTAGGRAGTPVRASLAMNTADGNKADKAHPSSGKSQTESGQEGHQGRMEEPRTTDEPTSPPTEAEGTGEAEGRAEGRVEEIQVLLPTTVAIYPPPRGGYGLGGLPPRLPSRG